MTGIDYGSGTWKNIERMLQKKLQEEREANDSVENTDAQTAMRRGRISMLKDLLALPRIGAAQAEVGEPD